jgi:hypothetical protein
VRDVGAQTPTSRRSTAPLTETHSAAAWGVGATVGLEVRDNCGDNIGGNAGFALLTTQRANGHIFLSTNIVPPD